MSFSFRTAGSMWDYLVQDCLVNGKQVGNTLEVVGRAAVLTDPNACVIKNSARQPSLAYAGAELAWYLKGTNKLEHLKKFAPSYGNFSDDGGLTANGAYGLRGLSLGSLADLAQRIRENPWSRQHVLVLWRQGDQGSKSKDVPCTVSLQFLYRDKLDLLVYMRSNDLSKGFLYDIFCFCMIQQLMASMTGHALGSYHHHVGSLHIYDSDIARLTKVQNAATATLTCALNVYDAHRLMRAFEGEQVESSHPSVNAILKAMHDCYRRN